MWAEAENFCNFGVQLSQLSEFSLVVFERKIGVNMKRSDFRFVGPFWLAVRDTKIPQDE